MADVIKGRYTAQTETPFVVFLIGMRINRLWAIHRWLPVLLAMPGMLIELAKHPEKGLLSHRVFLSGRVVMVVQYWRSFEQLEAFARNPNDPHLPAWQRFNKQLARSGVVGIFHETYPVAAAGFDVIYVDMPVFGLGKAVEHIPVAGRRDTARGRLGGESAPGVPVVGS